MKYATIEYDFNRPSNKVLKEPLDSDYGIAVRCWKNGSIVDAALSVDGLSATATTGTWQLFDLSTSSTPCTKNCTIGVDKPDTFNAEVESQQVQLKNSLPVPMNANAEIPLSTWLPAGEYNKNWFGLPQVAVVSGSTSGDWNDFEDANEIWIYPQANAKTYYYAQYVKGGNWSWYNKGTDNPIFTFDNSAVVRLNWHFKGSGQVSATLNMDVKSNDGVNGNFNLQVNETDLGYINVEEN